MKGGPKEDFSCFPALNCAPPPSKPHLQHVYMHPNPVHLQGRREDLFLWRLLQHLSHIKPTFSTDLWSALVCSLPRQPPLTSTSTPTTTHTQLNSDKCPRWKPLGWDCQFEQGFAAFSTPQSGGISAVLWDVGDLRADRASHLPDGFHVRNDLFLRTYTVLTQNSMWLGDITVREQTAVISSGLWAMGRLI